MEPEYIGAVKIKDGFFTGDQYAAQDLEFLVGNKVNYIINTTEELPNFWDSLGVFYLNLNWNLHEGNLEEIETHCVYNFIQKSLESGDSILVHSFNGQHRSIFIAAYFMMVSYKWSTNKTIEFLVYRNPDLQISDHYFSELKKQELKLQVTSRWTDLSETIHIESEELMLRNTYINAQNAPIADYEGEVEEKDFKLTWGDYEEDKLINPIIDASRILKSCLKNSDKKVLIPIKTRKKKDPLSILQTVQKTRVSTRIMKTSQVENYPNPVVVRNPLPRTGENKVVNFQAKNKPLAGHRPPSPLIKRQSPTSRRPHWR